MVIYDGPSLYDGEPIIVVAVPDWNKKTGLMLSTWILLRDVHPSLAAGDEQRDASICGSCKYRYDPETGERLCYVRVGWEPAMVWEKYHDGEYRHGGPNEANPWKLPVRLGSYGDPAVVPVSIWKSLVTTVDDPRQHTGYTHLWDDPSMLIQSNIAEGLRELCMASVDDLDERERAQRAGWRTFMVAAPGELRDQLHDVLCPASGLGGRKTTCANCVLCSGNTVAASSIWIPAHGPAFAV